MFTESIFLYVWVETEQNKYYNGKINIIHSEFEKIIV